MRLISLVAEMSGTVGAALAADGPSDGVATIARVPFPAVLGLSPATVAAFSFVEDMIALLCFRGVDAASIRNYA